MRSLLLSVFGAVGLALTFAPSAGTQTSEVPIFNQTEIELLLKAEKTPLKDVYRLLREEIEAKSYRHSMKLSQFLIELQKQLLREKKLVILDLDRTAFHDECPEAPKVEETEISFLDYPARMELGNLLRLACSKIATKNAGFRYRRGHIKITTRYKSQTYPFLENPVNGDYADQPLTRILDECSTITGTTILIDVRVKEKANKKVTAKFRNHVSLSTALQILTDMTDLDFLVIDNTVYVTSPENADRLRKKLQKHEKTKRPKNVPGLGI